MGMFDTVRVEMRIPGYSDIPDVDFQTKDLDCGLDIYTISGNGELYKELWDYEWVDNDAIPIIKGHLKRIEDTYRREYLTNLNDSITFYTIINDTVWREYTATFKNGKLTHITYEDTQINRG